MIFFLISPTHTWENNIEVGQTVLMKGPQNPTLLKTQKVFIFIPFLSVLFCWWNIKLSDDKISLWNMSRLHSWVEKKNRLTGLRATTAFALILATGNRLPYFTCLEGLSSRRMFWWQIYKIYPERCQFITYPLIYRFVSL